MSDKLYGYIALKNKSTGEKRYCPTVFFSGEVKILRGKKLRTADMAKLLAEKYQNNIDNMEKK